MKAKSPAKLNLSLEICGKRTDGLHHVISLLAPISLCDEIILEKAKMDQLKVTMSEILSGHSNSSPNLDNWSNNLATRAIDLLRKKNEISSQPLYMRLCKSIPWGAGLGGGSSNAGTVLKLFAEENKENPLSYKDLSIDLGADVAYFLKPQMGIMYGRGEELLPLIPVSRNSANAWKSIKVVILKPPSHSSTKEAYKSLNASFLDRSFNAEYRFLEKLNFANSIGLTSDLTLEDSNDIENWQKIIISGLAEAQNDFFPHRIKSQPLVARAVSLLREAQFSVIQLSGSGDTVFGLSLGEEKVNYLSEIVSITDYDDWFFAKVKFIL